jgi:uncharacterized protein YwqG
MAANGVKYADDSDDPRYEELLAGVADWRLLLQLDSEMGGDQEVLWGDVGRIYFWIRDEDLRAGRLDRTWTILQCS